MAAESDMKIGKFDILATSWTWPLSWRLGQTCPAQSVTTAYFFASFAAISTTTRNFWPA
jgi:hypothetical protein